MQNFVDYYTSMQKWSTSLYLIVAAISICKLFGYARAINLIQNSNEKVNRKSAVKGFMMVFVCQIVMAIWLIITCTT